MEGVALKRMLVVAVVLVGVVDAAVVAGAAAADDSPIVAVGPASDPNGSATGSGTVGSGGQTNACLNDQHSAVSPGSQDPSGAASINDRACTSSGGSGASSASGAATGGTGSRGSSASRAPSQAATARSSGVRRGQAGTSASRAAATVAASGARGVLIARINYTKTTLRTTGRLGVLVTIRDVDRRFVRGAIVFIRALPGAKPTLMGTAATFTNRRGQAGFTLSVPKRWLGKRLQFLVAARTPRAHALELASVRLVARAAVARA